MHRIMIYLCMIDQMIAEAETKGRAVPQRMQESSANACRARNIVICGFVTVHAARTIPLEPST